MHRFSAQVRLILTSLTSLACLIGAGSALAQQSVEDNIRPVAQVCLAGQPCVGSSKGGNTSRAAAPAAVSAPAPAAPAPVAAAVAAPVVAAAAPAATGFDAAATYQMSCFACHGTGAAGAPKLDDKEAWTARLEKGMDAVMANVNNGLNAMPAKGLCMTCSQDDLLALVEYMVNQ